MFMLQRLSSENRMTVLRTLPGWPGFSYRARVQVRSGAPGGKAGPALALLVRNDLKALLLQGFEDMKALARATLKESEKLYGVNDDMTVITVRVEERL